MKRIVILLLTAALLIAASVPALAQQGYGQGIDPALKAILEQKTPESARGFTAHVAAVTGVPIANAGWILAILGPVQRLPISTPIDPSCLHQYTPNIYTTTPIPAIEDSRITQLRAYMTLGAGNNGVTLNEFISLNYSGVGINTFDQLMDYNRKNTSGGFTFDDYLNDMVDFWGSHVK